MNKTRIEWADYTANPVRAMRIATEQRGHACTKISEGCARCYSERWNLRFGTRLRYQAERIKQVHFELHWPQVLGVIKSRLTDKRIFICDMMDLWHWAVRPELVAAVLAIAAVRPDLTFAVLTKRAHRMAQYFRDSVARAAAVQEAVAELLPHMTSDAVARYQERYAWPLENLWLGVSIENQVRANERLPDLLATPAARRFVSCEPLLGPVSLQHRPDGRNCMACGDTGHQLLECHHTERRRLDWVIVGGETGPGARPMEADWARALRDEAEFAGVPFFFKAWGESCEPGQMGEKTFVEVDAAVNLAGNPDYRKPFRVGRARAGRELDGRTWDDCPRSAGMIGAATCRDR